MLSLNAIFAADLLLVPVSADYLSLKSAGQVERALNALEPVFKRRLPRRYLLTRYDARRRMSADRGRCGCSELMRPDEMCVDADPRDREARGKPAVGLDIFRHAPDSRGAQDYAALYRRASECRISGLTAGPALIMLDHAFDVERVDAGAVRSARGIRGSRSGGTSAAAGARRRPASPP